MCIIDLTRNVLCLIVTVKAKEGITGLDQNQPIIVEVDDDDGKGHGAMQRGSSSGAQGNKRVDLTHVPAKTARQVIAKRVSGVAAEYRFLPNLTSVSNE